MPSPNKRFLEVGLWDKSDKPTKSEYQVLCHLAAHPGSRVLLWENDCYYAGITNCEVTGTPGTVVRGSVAKLRWGVIIQYERRGPWVEVDKESAFKCPQGAGIYKMTQEGFEAIAQYEARTRFETESLQLIKRLLREGRRSARALTPR